MGRKGIPTIGERGLRFRSRLEATWARMFTLLNWPWEYEPFDLDGYIPDFVLTFGKSPLLVEVKPEVCVAHLAQHCEKVDKSGWEREALIVGTNIWEAEDSWFPVLGLLKERGEWAPALLHDCSCCGKHSLHHSNLTWSCRVEGCYDGDQHLGGFMCRTSPDSQVAAAQRLMAQARNLTQWHPVPTGHTN